MNIYFDLDGTLIDVSERFYRLYYDLLDTFNCANKLSKERYWQLKRERFTEEEIVYRTCINVNIKEYNKLRQKLIESSKYLKYDIPFSYTSDTLKRLSGRHRLVIVSLRDSLKKTNKEINKFNLNNFFDKILVHNEDIDNKWKIKVELIKSDCEFRQKESIIVGDTEAEFLAAKGLDIPCYLVSSGIRTKEYLTSLNSYFVIENISELATNKYTIANIEKWSR